MNRVEILGGVVKEPELRFLPSGTAVVDLTVAVNGNRYDADSRQQVVTTGFISCSAFGWLAEQVAEMELLKGEEVHIVGELDQRSFERKDGSKDSKTKVAIKVLTPTRRKPMAASSAPNSRQMYSPEEEPF